MDILNIAGYKFINLNELEQWREKLLELCSAHELCGTILLSHEGMNITLAGKPSQVNLFKNTINLFFPDMTFKESFSDFIPFKKLKVKIKPEIITFRQDQLQLESRRAPTVTPTELKQWLDEKRDLTLLDTRNDYEVRFGTFKNAIHLAIDDFCELANKSKEIPRDKPIVMYCTGGIRCEKAGLYLMDEGFTNVYQLEGGILNYFNQVGSEHYDGECFVFDERISLDPSLKMTGTKQCTSCMGPIPVAYPTMQDILCSACNVSSDQPRNL